MSGRCIISLFCVCVARYTLCLHIYIHYTIKQLNRDPLNVTFHASAGHITIIRSITKNSNQRMSNIYPHGKQSKVMGGVKFETVHDVLT